MVEKKDKKIPIDDVINLKNRGYSNSQIIENLKKQNYNLQEISDAINQSEIKSSIDSQDLDLSSAPSPSQEPENIEISPPPEYNQQPTTSTSSNLKEFSTKLQPMQPQISDFGSYMGFERRDTYTEKIEEVTESIIKEKWNEFIKDIGDINIWKEKIKTDILSIKQEILRTHERFENLQRAVIGKVSEYDKDVKEIGTEIKALEKVLEKIIEPLTSNIKDLQKVTNELKTKKK